MVRFADKHHRSRNRYSYLSLIPVKNLTDWFDSVYLINCAHRPDRLATCLAHLQESGMADVERVTVYPAIIGDWTGHPAGFEGGNGAWGCLCSHQRILQDCLHHRGERGELLTQRVLILEDDVFFVPDALPRLNEFMENVPDNWGQLYLGGQHRKGVTKTEWPHVMKAGSVNRTHAYAVHSDYMAKIYQHISYFPDYVGNSYHVDHQLERAHRRGDWVVYCPERWIAGQRAGTSNVGKTMETDQLWS